MLKVYGDVLSGNCYKIKLLLEYLREPYEWVHVDIMKKESRTEEFLRMNPNGRVPVVEYAPGSYLAESNAILFYLSEGTPFWPERKIDRARVLNWLFFEQYSHEPYIATSRYILLYLKGAETHKQVLDEKRPHGYAALGVLEERLERNDFLVGDGPTIADIGLFAYTHVAGEGGFELAGYPATRRWIERMQALPNHVAIG